MKRTIRSIPGSITILLICFMIAWQGCETDRRNNRNIEKTLASLEKIDSFPFYSLVYYNDYRFDEYLNTGFRPGTPADLGAAGADDYMKCTCFAAKGGNTRFFGRNQDSGGRISVALMVSADPPDGYASLSMVWTPVLDLDRSHLPDSSVYRENLLLAPYYPTDGMNEMGVAIADMSVFSAEPPYDPEKMTIYRPDIIRLVLDYATDVDHAISLISNYNVDLFTGGELPTHYLIADVSGNSAVVEWVDGQMKVTRDENPWQVSTNFIISETDIPEQVTCWRYLTAYEALQERNGSLNEAEAMEILQDVSFSGTTYSCVYDLTNKELQIAINRDYQKVYSFSL